MDRWWSVIGAICTKTWCGDLSKLNVSRDHDVIQTVIFMIHCNTNGSTAGQQWQQCMPMGPMCAFEVNIIIKWTSYLKVTSYQRYLRQRRLETTNSPVSEEQGFFSSKSGCFTRKVQSFDIILLIAAINRPVSMSRGNCFSDLQYSLPVLSDELLRSYRLKDSGACVMSFVHVWVCGCVFMYAL